MDYKKLLCSVMLLGSFGTSTLVAYGEETTDFTSIQESSSTINSSSSTVKTDDSISQEADSGLVNSDTTSSSNEQTKTSSESGAVDEEEYDAQGNLQFHHPVRFEDFTLEPPAFRSARSAVNTQQAFINQIAPSAKTLASANNLYASVMIAQAIVESGWGSSTLSKAPNYNLFGIKGTYN
jgi:flagellum-specific peptidoglycan hydrolase FlgJ